MSLKELDNDTGLVKLIHLPKKSCLTQCFTFILLNTYCKKFNVKQENMFHKKDNYFVLNKTLNTIRDVRLDNLH